MKKAKNKRERKKIINLRHLGEKKETSTVSLPLAHTRTHTLSVPPFL